MLKYCKKGPGHLAKLTVAALVCLPLAGCLNAADPWGEGSLAYTTDEMYPIGAHKKCGQEWPDLANDQSNHYAPNHGCAVHSNIAAMVADPRVLKRPRKLDPTPANTAAGAITIYEYNSGTLSSGSTFGGSGAASGSGANKP